ncbi:MAG TPA: hypothetical protein VGT78_01005 [Rhizomicrobium sp.]|nr:hypothetical protein [Rhizomicrobium sp.]
MTDIFDFWKEIGPADHIHPADRDTFIRNPSHGFDHRGLPGCFMGPLQTAPVVLLYLSPGADDGADAESQTNQKRQMRMRAGNEPLPSDADNEATWKWWKSRTDCFGEDWRILRSRVAFLNIGAYHSKEMRDVALLLTLPSSRVTLDWATTTLFQQAMAGERVVVCMRSRKLWGLSNGRTGISLFAPEVTRGGHMHHGSMRQEIVAAVKKRLGKS